MIARRRRVASALLPLLLAPPALALSDFGLKQAPPVPLPADSDPYHVRALDVTADGVPDLIEVSVFATDQHVLVGEGAFTFGQPVSTSCGGVQDFDLGDMDGDGLPDLVRVPAAAPTGLQVLLADGAGAFAPAGSIDLGLELSYNGQGLRLLDANEDGQLDALVQQNSGLRIVIGDGAGGFASAGPALQNSGLAAIGEPQAADLNGDGHVDLVISGNALFFTGWSVWVGDGTGAFQVAHTEYTSVDADIADSELADFDGDGLTDYVQRQEEVVGTGSGNKLVLARGDGIGLAPFIPPIKFVPPGLSAIAAADLDGDGFADLLGDASTSGGTRLWVLLGHGDFGFAAAQLFDISNQDLGLRDVALSDLDGNGVLDALLLGSSPPQILIFASTSLPSGWSDLGHALAGRGQPALAGAGPLVAGAGVSLSLSSAAASSPALLVVGATPLWQPFKGGVLVPHPDLLVALVTDGSGSAVLPGRWPTGLPVASSVLFQVWIPDTAGPAGFAASNAVGAKVAPE